MTTYEQIKKEMSRYMPEYEFSLFTVNFWNLYVKVMKSRNELYDKGFEYESRLIEDVIYHHIFYIKEYKAYKFLQSIIYKYPLEEC